MDVIGHYNVGVQAKELPLLAPLERCKQTFGDARFLKPQRADSGPIKRLVKCAKALSRRWRPRQGSEIPDAWASEIPDACGKRSVQPPCNKDVFAGGLPVRQVPLVVGHYLYTVS